MSRRLSKWILKAVLVACTLAVFVAAEARQMSVSAFCPFRESCPLRFRIRKRLTRYEMSVDQASLTKRESVTMGG